MDARRSTRVERSIPLIISGQNRLGEPFQERTSAISLNLHGCRYPSRHDYLVGTWIALQIAETSAGPNSTAVRAQVRSIHSPKSPRELHQIGVELEIPANVWGIPEPPEDWFRLTAGKIPMAPAAAAGAPAREPIPIDANLAPPQATSEPENIEAAQISAPPLTAARPDTEKEIAPARPARVVITPDELVQALQGKLQQAAEKAVQSALATRLDDAVRGTVSAIEDIRRASMQQVEDYSAWQREVLSHLPAEQNLALLEARLSEARTRSEEQLLLLHNRAEEIVQRLEKLAVEARNDLTEARKITERITRECEPQIRARLDDSVANAAEKFEGEAARVSDRHLVRLMEDAQRMTRELFSQLETRSAEARSLLQSASNATVDEFRRQVELQADLTISETSQRVTSSLAALDAESRAACEARHRSLEQEVSRAAEQSTEQFRKAIKAFLYSCLVAAVSAVDEHTKSTLEGLVADPGRAFEDSGHLPPSSGKGQTETQG